METLLQDVRYALASMRRHKGFTAAGLLTLGLGIGATTAVFSVVYGVLLRPLPYPDAQRLVRLSEEHAGAVSPLRTPMLSNLTYHAWNGAPRTVDALAAYSGREHTVTMPGGAVRMEAAAVTPTLFPLVGATPALGRLFRDADASPDANGAPHRVIVLSDRLWREHFGSDPAIVGRGLQIDGKPHEIMGVTRPGFYFPDRDTLLWAPLAIAQPDPQAETGRRGSMSVINVLARLRPGVTPAQAAAEGTAAARTTPRPMAADLIFGTGGPVVVHVRTLLDEMTADIRPALIVLGTAVGLVLLIACANVANLFLSRGVARQRELTVRAAIGATRARLARQLLTESLVLSICGGALGLALGWALVRIAPALATRDFPRLDDVRIDPIVMGFAAVSAVFTALASGLAPALRGARFNLSASLHGGDGASAGGFRGLRAQRLRDGLLVAEAALAVMLLVGAMLLARSFVTLTRVDAGYTPQHVLVGEVFIPGYDASEVLSPQGTGKAEHVASLVTTLLERLRATPGVEAAGAGNMMPLDDATQIAGFPAPWNPPSAKPVAARALQYTITTGYDNALGLRLRAGRFFTDADRASGTRAWIVNEEFARLYLPPNPVGFRFEQRPASGPITIEIVGIVGNVLKNGNASKPQPEYYRLPRDLTRFYGRFQVAVRTRGDAAAAAQSLRAIARELEPIAAIETTTLSARVAASIEQPRFAMAVLASFAVLALVLASVGLYSVVSYGVSQRRRELGVRAALGAAKRDLVRLVLCEGLRATAIGLVCGLAAAAGLTRLMQGLLFGVTPLDGVAFVAAPALLLPIAVVACLVPAWRAASTDPSEALRCE